MKLEELGGVGLKTGEIYGNIFIKDCFEMTDENI